LVPAGASESWIGDAASETIELRVPGSLLQSTAVDMGLDPDRIGLAPECQLRDARIEHIAWALAAEARAEIPTGLIYRESLGVALAVHILARYRRTSREPSAGLTPLRMRRVVDYVEAHLRDDVSLERLARIAGVSPSHFRALFRRSMGIPVHEYVIQRRVERARALLTRGELSTGQVAFEAGFAHQSHMARCMRRVLGVTPAAIARSRARG